MVGYIPIMIATLNALAEPNRLNIVEILREAPRSVGEIADRLRLRQPQASKHLRVLHRAGLVAVRPHAQRRIYELRAEPLQELDAWLAQYRRLWEGRFAHLDGLLNELQNTEEHHGPDNRRARITTLASDRHQTTEEIVR